MRKNMHGLLSVILTLSLLVTMFAFPVGAMASSGYAATRLGSSSSAKIRNIERVNGALSGYTVTDGSEFSFNHVVGERSKERGYENAENGRGVKVYGGGTAQVATTLYLALKDMDGIYFDELSTYGSKFTDDYVESGDDAIVVDWQSGIDLSFKNKTGRTLTIYAWTDDDELRVSVDESDTVLGYGTTSIYGGSNKLNNIELAAEKIDGVQLSHNDIFSFNSIVGPRTESKGYLNAVNGRGVKVVGGGVAQVASAVWLAIKDMDDIDVREKKTYGKRYSETYVDSADDAIVTDYNADTDFSFRYTGDDTITIHCYVQYDTLVCEITLDEAVG